MSFPVFFIEIGHQVKILQLSEGKPPVVHSFHSIPIDHLWLKKQPKETQSQFFQTVIFDFLKKYSSKGSKVCLILKDSCILARSYIFPDLSWEEIRQSIREKILDTSGFHEDSLRIFLDIFRIPPYTHRQKCLVKAFAVPSALIDEAVSILKEKGASSVYCLHECLAGVPHLIPSYQKNGVYGVIRIGFSSTIIAISKNGILLMSRYIPTGDSNFTKVFMGEIVLDGITFTVDPAEAEEIKKLQGICQSMTLGDDLNVKLPPEVSNPLLEPLLENLSREVNRFISFVKNEHELENIDQIFVIGKGAQIKNLDAYFENVLQIPVKSMSVSQLVSFDTSCSQNAFKENEHIFSHLLGGILNYNKTDLLKKESRVLKWFKNLDKYYPLILFCLLIVCYGMLETYNQGFQKKANELEKQWADKVVKYSVYFKTQKNKEDYLESLSEALEYKKKQVPWAGFLKNLSRNTYNGVVIDVLDVCRERNSSPLFPFFQCKLEGKIEASSSEESPEKVLSGFLDFLNESPWVESVEIVSFSKNDKGLGKHFIIKCNMELYN